jgi:integral membrane protein (TIGR01906 family)
MDKVAKKIGDSLSPGKITDGSAGKRIMLLIFVALIPFLLILLSYKANLNMTDYTPEQKDVIDFLQYKNSLTAEMSALEFSHLVDVKKVMEIIDFIFYALLSICALILTYNYRDQFKLKKPLLYGGLSSLSLIVPLSLFALVNFELAFVFFHKIFFPRGNWIFSQSSFLIRTFPPTFFISMTKKIILTALSFAVIFILISLKIKKDGRV